MPILYSLVARGTAVLAEYSATAGNANSVARRILENLPTGELEETRVSYSQDGHLFHVSVSRGNLIYVCMESFGRRIPYAFLEDIRVAFTSTHDEEEVRDAGAYAFNAEFSRVLSRKMELYTGGSEGTAAAAASSSSGGGGGSGDVITRIQGEICEVKNVMIENIEKVLERGDKIELLVDKTDHLQADAFRFRRQTREVKKNAWWTNAKMVFIVVVVVLFVAYFTTAQFCNLTLSKCVKVRGGGGGGGTKGGAGGSNSTAGGGPNSSPIDTAHAFVGGRW